MILLNRTCDGRQNSQGKVDRTRNELTKIKGRKRYYFFPPLTRVDNGLELKRGGELA